MRTTRVGALVAGSALSLGLLTVTTPAAHAAPVNPEAGTAATWLASTIGEDGLIPGAGLDTFFYAANLDFGVSLALTGQVPSAALSQIQPGVDATIDEYVGVPTAVANAGKVARAAYYYEVTGGDASDAGNAGLDLAAALAAHVDDTTGALGTSNSAYDQVWAVFALHALGSDEADEARDFLVGQRGPDAADGWGYDDGTWNNDPDATSWAIRALAPWASDAEVAVAISAGAAYLTSVQDETGGIEAPFLGVNANSTGLAADALGATGHAAAAAKAARWLAEHQVIALPACGINPANAGAVAYNDDAYADGIADDELEQTGPATAQAIAGLAFLPARTAALVAPTGYVQAGSTVSATVLGLRPGQIGCLSGAAAPVKITGAGSVAVTAPSGSTTSTLTLSTLGGQTTATIKVLGAKTIPVRVAKKVKRKKKLNVLVSGLAVGEKVTVRFRKQTVRGAASPAGTFIARIKVGKKLGKAKVIVTGEFANRKNTKTVRVVR